MHGEILEISCCSITVKSDISGGDGLGSILLSSEYNLIMFLSIEQRLHTSFDIFIPICRSLQIEQKFIDREICSNSNLRIQSITLLK
jgi:hypothetical protein